MCHVNPVESCEFVGTRDNSEKIGTNCTYGEMEPRGKQGSSNSGASTNIDDVPSENHLSQIQDYMRCLMQRRFRPLVFLFPCLGRSECSMATPVDDKQHFPTPSGIVDALVYDAALELTAWLAAPRQRRSFSLIRRPARLRTVHCHYFCWTPWRLLFAI